MYDFGPLASQNDYDLLSYFHVTRQASGFVDFSSERPAFIFVARPGAGKTALLQWLKTYSKDPLTIVVGTETTRISSGDSQLNVGDIRVMITAELFAALISVISEQGQGSPQALKEAKEFLSKGWKQIVGGFFRQNFVGLSILGNGFTLKPDDRRSYLQEIRRTNRLAAGRTVLKRLAGTTKIAFVMDDPESIVGEGLNEVTAENARRLGAFLSVLAEVHSLGVRVIVFLKEHIWQNIRAYYSDYSHFTDRLEGLEWTGADLIRMLERRVSTRLNTAWDNVFEFSQETIQRQIFPFLVNGPRDLLNLCNIAGRESGKISIARLEKGIRAHKTDKWRDLSTYYGGQWPGIDQFARAMADSLKAKYGKKPIPIGAVNAEFEAQFGNPQSDVYSLRKRIEWIDSAYFERRPIDERLFVIGCLGYILEKEKFYPWSGRDIERFRLADSHFISPVFAE